MEGRGGQITVSSRPVPIFPSVCSSFIAACFITACAVSDSGFTLTGSVAGSCDQSEAGLMRHSHRRSKDSNRQYRHIVILGDASELQTVENLSGKSDVGLFLCQALCSYTREVHKAPHGGW